jgi:AcrR family transcriptional regulator
MSKKNNKTDPRIIRTRQLLRSSLIELITEKNYSAITIQDITDRATLNRATFYLHYRDKNELLSDVLNELLTSASPLPALDGQPITEYALNSITSLFNQFATKSKFYRAMLSGENIPTFNSLVQQYIQEVGLKWIAALQPDETMITANPEVVTHYLGSAFLGVVTWWLQNDMPYLAQDMASQLIQLTTKGLYQILGLEAPNES